MYVNSSQHYCPNPYFVVFFLGVLLHKHIRIHKWTSPRIKTGMRPGQESCAFSFETETRTRRDLNIIITFPIFWDETRPET